MPRKREATIERAEPGFAALNLAIDSPLGARWWLVVDATFREWLLEMDDQERWIQLQGALLTCAALLHASGRVGRYFTVLQVRQILEIKLTATVTGMPAAVRMRPLYMACPRGPRPGGQTVSMAPVELRRSEAEFRTWFVAEFGRQPTHADIVADLSISRATYYRLRNK